MNVNVIVKIAGSGEVIVHRHDQNAIEPTPVCGAKPHEVQASDFTRDQVTCSACLSA